VLRPPATDEVGAQRGAARFAEDLTRAFPDAVALFCEADRIALDVAEADFRIKIHPATSSTAGRMDIKAVFRASGAVEGTWWTQWTLEVGHGPTEVSSAAALLVNEVRASRRRFARMLAHGQVADF
jgi:hypothetical protein